MGKAVYTFIRGKFGRWSTPMWEGETRAFKLIRELRKQGIKGILYEEGPEEAYSINRGSHIRNIIYHNMYNLTAYKGSDWKEVDLFLLHKEFFAPSYFQVSFDSPR